MDSDCTVEFRFYDPTRGAEIFGRIGNEPAYALLMPRRRDDDPAPWELPRCLDRVPIDSEILPGELAELMAERMTDPDICPLEQWRPDRTE
jgi:hypothetical protein